MCWLENENKWCNLLKKKKKLLQCLKQAKSWFPGWNTPSGVGRKRGVNNMNSTKSEQSDCDREEAAKEKRKSNQGRGILQPEPAETRCHRFKVQQLLWRFQRGPITSSLRCIVSEVTSFSLQVPSWAGTNPSCLWKSCSSTGENGISTVILLVFASERSDFKINSKLRKGPKTLTGSLERVGNLRIWGLKIKPWKSNLSQSFEGRKDTKQKHSLFMCGCC